MPLIFTAIYFKTVINNYSPELGSRHYHLPEFFSTETKDPAYSTGIKHILMEKKRTPVHFKTTVTNATICSHHYQIIISLQHHSQSSGKKINS